MNSTDNADATPLIPVGSVLVGLAFFALMDAAMKSVAITLGAYNAIFWRVLIAVVLVGIFYALRRPKIPTRSTMKIHIQRGILMVFMAFLFFWALIRVPIAEAVALTFISPIIALYLAAVFLGETVHKNAIYASVLGLAGVGVIAWGKMSGEYTSDELWGFIAVIISAVLYAANLVIQRRQALVADPVEISFYQNLIFVVCYALVAPFFAVIPSAEMFPLLLGAALLSIISALFIAWGYRRAEAQILINLEYSMFIWAAIFGWAFFSEPVTVATLIGTILIVIGCVLASRRGKRKLPVVTNKV